MADLEQRLTELAAAIEWPPTPQLRVTSPQAGKVARLGEPKPPHSWGGWREAPGGEAGWGRGFGSQHHNRWTLVAAAAIVAALALFAYTPSRTAIADWLNLHVFIQQVQHPIKPSPLPPGPLGKRLGLGDQTTLPQAQAQIVWHIAVPASLGNPDEVYVQPPADAPAKGEVTLVYSARPGIPVAGQTGVSVLVTEARGAVNANFFGKMLGPGTTLEQLTVAGHQAYWISGKPHDFFFADANGSFRTETLRLATNTLILDDGGTIIRIEGDLTRSQALQIAASLG